MLQVPSATSPIGLLTSWGKHDLAQNLSMIYLPQHILAAVSISFVCDPDYRAIARDQAVTEETTCASAR